MGCKKNELKTEYKEYELDKGISMQCRTPTKLKGKL